MRILLIITDYGSFNNFISEVAVNLSTIGHEVHVICSKVKVIDFEDKFPYESMGITFHYLSFPRSFNVLDQISSSYKINRRIIKINPDIINIHFTTAIFTTLIYAKPPFFTMGTIHGVGYPRIQNPLKRKVFEIIEKYAFRKLDQIYLINQFDYDLVKHLYPQKANRYNSCGVGCDFRKFDPYAISESNKDAFREKLSIGSDDFVMAFIGRFVSFKGFDLLIRSMITLSKKPQYKHMKLLLIGGEDPAHTTGLTKKEKDFCLRNKQIIRTGFTGDVNLYLSITNLFVFPSIKEGMPVCIMEALAMGVPVITSNSRGCNDLIEDNYNGFLLSESPSVEEITEAILKLFEDRNLLSEFARNALSKRNELNREMYVNHQVQIYKEVSRANVIDLKVNTPDFA